MKIDNIRLSQQAKDQLLRLKRKTGIQNWNVLCRWGFCMSLADPTPPTVSKIPADSSVEMTWKVFGGQYQEIYSALVKQRCYQDGLGTSDKVLVTQFRLHLHRGISYLAADSDLKNISNLLSKSFS